MMRSHGAGIYRISGLASLIMLTAVVLTAQSKTYPQQIREHRRNYRQAFLQNPASPLNQREVRGLQFYKPNPAFRVTARVERPAQSAPFTVATSSGETQEFVIYGFAIFHIQGQIDTLALLRSTTLSRMPQYRNLLFVPFLDDTNGDTTYGGGRYLDCQLTDIHDDQLTLDFNLAYNPYCAYKDHYSCPIPPAMNTINHRIEVGEKQYHVPKSH